MMIITVDQTKEGLHNPALILGLRCEFFVCAGMSIMVVLVLRGFNCVISPFVAFLLHHVKPVNLRALSCSFQCIVTHFT